MGLIRGVVKLQRKLHFQCVVSGGTKVCYTGNISNSVVSASGVDTWGSDITKESTLLLWGLSCYTKVYQTANI